MSIRVKDNGAKRALKTLGSKQPAVLVGILGADVDKPAAQGDVTVGQVAEWAEYGLGQPMRSWLRAWIDENINEINARMAAESRAVYEGKITPAQAAARVGAWIVGQIQLRIAAGIDPPNADSTIDRKGSSTPLIDTGQLRSSITSRVE